MHIFFQLLDLCFPILSPIFLLLQYFFTFSLSLGFLLTGHGSLNSFLHKSGLSESENRMLGLGPEDWRLLLTTCPLYADLSNLEVMGIIETEAMVDFSRA